MAVAWLINFEFQIHISEISQFPDDEIRFEILRSFIGLCRAVIALCKGLNRLMSVPTELGHQVASKDSFYSSGDLALHNIARDLEQSISFLKGNTVACCSTTQKVIEIVERSFNFRLDDMCVRTLSFQKSEGKVLPNDR